MIVDGGKVMSGYSIRQDLPPVKLDRAAFERLIELLLEEFTPAEPVLRIKDSSDYGSNVRANGLADFLAHPDLPAGLHMVNISARDPISEDEAAPQRRIDVLLHNTGPRIIIEAEDFDWAQSAAGTIHYFLSSHRPWHFMVHGIIAGPFAGAAFTGILFFGIRLIYKIVTWNLTADLVLSSLAGVAGSVAALLTALLPEVDIQLGNERDRSLVKMENTIRNLAALAVALLILRHWT
jgi:hypothetical protein